MCTEVDEIAPTEDEASIGMASFKDNGTIDFPVVPPISAPDMKPNQQIVDRLLAAVELVLNDIDVQSYCKPSLCFRPKDDSFELYKISAVVPGTIGLRTGKGAWQRGRRRK